MSFGGPVLDERTWRGFDYAVALESALNDEGRHEKPLVQATWAST